MKKKTLILSLASGLFLANAAFANGTEEKGKPFDISTIEYIEDEVTIDLGFDTSEYLPEGFDPYKMYVNLNAIEFIEEEVALQYVKANLPEGFDAYAAPTDVQSINYIDVNDTLNVDFDTTAHLPEGFNAFSK